MISVPYDPHGMIHTFCKRQTKPPKMYYDSRWCLPSSTNPQTMSSPHLKHPYLLNLNTSLLRMSDLPIVPIWDQLYYVPSNLNLDRVPNHKINLFQAETMRDSWGKAKSKNWYMLNQPPSAQTRSEIGAASLFSDRWEISFFLQLPSCPGQDFKARETIPSVSTALARATIIFNKTIPDWAIWLQM